MKHWKLALAVLLPLAGLATGIVRQEIEQSRAVTWIIPVEGFDPRDPLRGHYIRFRYRWTVEGDSPLCDKGLCRICLEHRNGTVVARIERKTAPATCPHPVDLQASHMEYGFTSQIYVSEASAPQLEQSLREGPMEVVAHLTRDGRLINQRLQPAGTGR